MKRGRRARIYSGTNYCGDTLTLSGPLSLADMTGPGQKVRNISKALGFFDEFASVRLNCG